VRRKKAAEALDGMAGSVVAIGRAAVVSEPRPLTVMGDGPSEEDTEPDPADLAADLAWGRALRRFARDAVWALPVGAICLALTGIWGWPTPTREPSGQSPGTWLVVTLLGLVLGLVGVLGLAALLSPTAARPWALAAVVGMLAGTVLVAPVLGVVALARPSVSRATDHLGPILTAHLEARFFDNAVSRWLAVGGLALLAAGWLALGCAVLACRVLNRFDGAVVLLSVALAVLGAYLSWQFLTVLAAMGLLAAGLGLAWTAARLTPDTGAPEYR
jgi:hypothetical protein